MENITDLLSKSFKSAQDAIAPTHGEFEFDGSSVNVGKMELPSGEVALVRITFDKSDIEDYCDDISELTELKYQF